VRESAPTLLGLRGRGVGCRPIIGFIVGNETITAIGLNSYESCN